MNPPPLVGTLLSAVIYWYIGAIQNHSKPYQHQYRSFPRTIFLFLSVSLNLFLSFSICFLSLPPLFFPFFVMYCYQSKPYKTGLFTYLSFFFIYFVLSLPFLSICDFFSLFCLSLSLFSSLSQYFLKLFFYHFFLSFSLFILFL